MRTIREDDDVDDDDLRQNMISCIPKQVKLLFCCPCRFEKQDLRSRWDEGEGRITMRLSVMTTMREMRTSNEEGMEINPLPLIFRKGEGF